MLMSFRRHFRKFSRTFLLQTTILERVIFILTVSENKKKMP